MKCLKILVSLVLIILCFPVVNVSATDVADEGFAGKYVLSEEELELARGQALEKAKANAKESIPQTRMDEIVENWVRVGTGISNESPRGLVFNQISGGYKYSSGGGMYWGKSTTTSGTVSVGITIGGQYGSFSIAYAPGTRMSSSGHFATCPSNLWNKYVKLYSTTRYEVTKYNVYRKNKYESGQGTFVRTSYVPVPYSYAFYFQAV